MPVILRPEDEKKWLDPIIESDEIFKILKAYPANEMEAYPISTLVNNPRSDVPEVLKRV
jgi:putative SOS response-associated peptidase YedK